LAVADVDYITNEVTDVWVSLRAEHLLHLGLLELIAAKYDELAWPMLSQHDFHEFPPKGSATARNQHYLFIPVYAHGSSCDESP
jgi:hypothetical protein